MEALVSLSLASNIMQIITFGRETISLCKRIYHTGLPEPGLSDNGRNLAQLSKGLSGQLDEHPKPLDRSDHELLIVARKSADAAKDLCDEINFLSMPNNWRGLPTVLAVTIKSAWRKRRLDRLEKTMADFQRTMETSLLVHIRSKTALLEVQQQEGFEKLDAKLKNFIEGLLRDQASLSKLFIRSSNQVKAHVTLETSQMTKFVTSHLDVGLATKQQSLKEHFATATERVQNSLHAQMQRLDSEATKERIRCRLLDSLKFTDMNDRKNQIATSCPRTFLWIFDPGVDDGSESGSEVTWDLSKNVQWDKFLHWLQSDEKLYLITGKPGSGKSVLMKFILSQPETLRALEKWRAGTRILSHFFWNPGTLMQRNIKGLLCSLLHQVLDANFDFELFDKRPNLRSKAWVSDWAIDDLWTLALDLLRTSSQTYCVFLDGLDEVCHEDGIDDLLNVVQDLQKIPQLKICVASRPEPAIRRRFDASPSLRMQDLTVGDLRIYAQAELFKSLEQSSDIIYELVDELVDKSQGIFLWVVLAVKSLRRGLDNQDSTDMLSARLKAMPTDLSQLYEEMWLRLNDDSEIYRRTASLYFRLFLASRDLDQLQNCFKRQNVSLFELAVASSTDIQATLFNETTLASVAHLKEVCESAIRDIEIRCAGLLELSQPSDRKLGRKVDDNVPVFELFVEDLWILDEEDADVPEEAVLTGRTRLNDMNTLLTYTDLTINFIHRTALDFLTDTVTGQKILNSTSENARSAVLCLFKACLVRCKLWLFEKIETSSDHQKLIGITSSLRHFLRHLEELCGGTNSGPKLNEGDIEDLFCLCRRWYKMGYLKTMLPQQYNMHRGYYKTSFFAIVAHTKLTSMVEKHLRAFIGDASWNSDYLSLLLGVASDLGGYDLDTFQQRSRSVQLLLHLGADPNSRQHEQIYAGRLNDPYCPWVRALEDMLYIQEKIIYQSWGFASSDHHTVSEEILKILEAFIRSGADLDGRALIRLDAYKSRRPVPYSGRGSLPMAMRDTDGGTYMVVLEVSLSMFLDCILNRLHPDVRMTDSLVRTKNKMSQRSARIVAFGGDFPSPLDTYILESEVDSDYLLDPIYPWFTDAMPFPESEEERYGTYHRNWFQIFRERTDEVLRKSKLPNVSRQDLGRHLQHLGYMFPAKSQNFKVDIPKLLI